ncbi:diacylglycerol/lipid kinase family protein [Nocardiopsis halophila]|uniref:diacylglycerol/lipid kinase family protein n=1 Tax=Nocardiopsis halophila TaxID=141692 RepID=UPI000347D9D9|nr:diacylglycerol kinase family protein [Nocardiopsis halophila]
MLIITNTAAGSAETDVLRAAAAEELDGAEVVSCSDPRGLEEALEGGHGTVVAAGGDGSLHALANALYRRGELASRTVGLVPMGTGNDFARTLGLPLEVPAAVAALARARPRPLDLIVDDTGEVTVNAVHLGVGADSTREAARWKRLLGPLSFPVGGAIAGAAARGYRLRIVADGAEVDGSGHRLLMVGLANGRFIGGGAGRVFPGAAPDSGVMDLVVSRSRGLAGRALHALRLRRGTHPTEAEVHHRPARTVSVTALGEPCSASADGEVAEGVTARTWRVLPGAWTFLVPEEDDRADPAARSER